MNRLPPSPLPRPSGRALACVLGTCLAAAIPLLAGPISFEAEVIDDSVEIGYGVAIGEVDGDGRPDVLLADKREFSWYRNPDWEETPVARNLTLRDNVCLAAADVDGDDRVEVAVGARWNPGETTDRSRSGAVFYLARPGDLSRPWKPIPLDHDPTTHRMRWVPDESGRHHLVVLPLHGIGNVRGKGENGTRVRAYTADPGRMDDPDAWTDRVVDEQLHRTHNFDHEGDTLLVAGAEGMVERPVDVEEPRPGLLISPDNSQPPTRGAGEVRRGDDFIAAIEPMHGNELVVYRREGEQWNRRRLTDAFAEGHALGIADMDGDGREDIVAGWRKPNADGHVGIELYRQGADGGWKQSWVAKDLVATEDLKLADLDDDDRPDVIASGRATGNLVILWNRK